ncbi:MAG: hypothetical protein Q7S06_00735 [Nanoarchaeota archaeon]|nr:hypothetical protein [Nanoarchaeota archaeon]
MFTLRYWKIDEEKRGVKKREVCAGRTVFKTLTYDLTEALQTYRKEIKEAGCVLSSAQETIYISGKELEVRDLSNP